MWRNAFYPVSCITLLMLVAKEDIDPPAFLLLLGVVWTSVVIHELGHALSALLTGGRVLRVRALPWHGMTTVRQAGPLAGAVVAFAGPLAGIVTAAAGWAFLDRWGAGAASAAASGPSAILTAIVIDNLLNLIPVWILDGNFIVRHLRAWRRERAVARALAPAVPPDPARVVEAFLESLRGDIEHRLGRPTAGLAESPPRTRPMGAPRTREDRSSSFVGRT